VQIRFFDFGFFLEVPDPEIGVRPWSIHKSLFFGKECAKSYNNENFRNETTSFKCFSTYATEHQYCVLDTKTVAFGTDGRSRRYSML